MTAYDTLLRDLCRLEPRNGFQSTSDFNLTEEQLIVALEHEPDIFNEALALESDRFVTFLRSSKDATAQQLFLSVVMALVRKEAKRQMLNDLICMADTVAEEARVDQEFA